MVKDVDKYQEHGRMEYLLCALRLFLGLQWVQDCRICPKGVQVYDGL